MVLSLHGRVATAIVLYLTVVGVWGLILGARGLGPTSGFIGALLVAEIAAVAQGLFGLVLLFSRPPSQSLHVLYGFALALAFPLAATMSAPTNPGVGPRRRAPRIRPHAPTTVRYSTMAVATRPCSESTTSTLAG